MSDHKIHNPRGLPVIPRLPPHQPANDGAVAICGECGRTIYQVEGYYCGNNRCPVQSHAVCIAQ